MIKRKKRKKNYLFVIGFVAVMIVAVSFTAVNVAKAQFNTDLTHAILLGVVSILDKITVEKTPIPIVDSIVENIAIGALTGPDLPYTFFSFGGVRFHALRGTLNQATSSVACAIQAPTATSTFIGGSFVTTEATSTAYLVTFAKSTTRGATTTIIGSEIFVAANARAEIVASTTAVGDLGTFNFKGNASATSSTADWLNISIKGLQHNFLLDGTCSAVWREI